MPEGGNVGARQFVQPLNALLAAAEPWFEVTPKHTRPLGACTLPPAGRGGEGK